jgi:hypothetical protein
MGLWKGAIVDIEIPSIGKEAVFIARFSTVAPLNSKTGVFWTSKIYGFASSINLYSLFCSWKNLQFLATHTLHKLKNKSNG